MNDNIALDLLNNFKGQYTVSRMVELANYLGFVTSQGPRKDDMVNLVDKIKVAQSSQDYVPLFDKLKLIYPNIYKSLNVEVKGKTSLELSQRAWTIIERVKRAVPHAQQEPPVVRPIIIEQSSSSSPRVVDQANPFVLVSGNEHVQKLVGEIVSVPQPSKAQLMQTCKILDQKELNHVFSNTGLIPLDTKSTNKTSSCSAIIHAIETERIHHPNQPANVKRVLREPLTSIVEDDNNFASVCKSSYTISNINQLYHFAEGTEQLSSRDKEQACLKTKNQIRSFLKKWMKQPGVSEEDIIYGYQPPSERGSGGSVPEAKGIVKPCVHPETRDWNCDLDAEYCNVVKEPIQSPENTCEPKVIEMVIGGRKLKGSSELLRTIAEQVKRISGPNMEKISLGQEPVSPEELEPKVFSNQAAQAAAMNQEERRIYQLQQEEAQRLQRIEQLDQEEARRRQQLQLEEEQIRQRLSQLEERRLAQLEEQEARRRQQLQIEEEQIRQRLSKLEENKRVQLDQEEAQRRLQLDQEESQRRKQLAQQLSQQLAKEEERRIQLAKEEERKRKRENMMRVEEMKRKTLEDIQRQIDEQKQRRKEMVIEEEPVPQKNLSSASVASASAEPVNNKLEFVQEINVDSNEFDEKQPEEEVVLVKPVIRGTVPVKIEPSSMVKESERKEQEEREARNAIKAQKKRVKEESFRLKKIEEIVPVVEVSIPSFQLPSKEAPVEVKYEAPVEVKYEAPVEVKYEAPVEVKYEEPIEMKYEAPVEVRIVPVVEVEQKREQLKKINSFFELEQARLQEKGGSSVESSYFPEEQYVQIRDKEETGRIQQGSIPEPSAFSVFKVSSDISEEARKCLNKLAGSS